MYKHRPGVFVRSLFFSFLLAPMASSEEAEVRRNTSGDWRFLAIEQKMLDVVGECLDRMGSDCWKMKGVSFLPYFSMKMMWIGY